MPVRDRSEHKVPTGSGPETVAPSGWVAQAGPMKFTEVPRDSIVVGIDGSEHADRAVDWAARQASLEQRPLVLLHAQAPPLPWGMRELDGIAALDTIDVADGGLLEGAAVRARAVAPGLTLHAVHGGVDPREALLAASERAALLVLGSRGRGPVGRLLLGSVSVAVSTHSHCPVVVVRPDRTTGTGRVVVAVDGSNASLPVLEFAFRHAALHQAPLSVVHCYFDVVARSMIERRVPADEPGVDDLRLLLAESVAGFGERYPDVRLSLELDRGLVDQLLVGESLEADLVVVGRRDRSGLDRLFSSSVSTTIVERAHCPVAVVPEPGDSEHPTPLRRATEIRV